MLRRWSAVVEYKQNIIINTGIEINVVVANSSTILNIFVLEIPA